MAIIQSKMDILNKSCKTWNSKEVMICSELCLRNFFSALKEYFDETSEKHQNKLEYLWKSSPQKDQENSISWLHVFLAMSGIKYLYYKI